MKIIIEGIRGEGKTQVLTDIARLLRSDGYTNITIIGKNKIETQRLERIAAEDQHYPIKNKKAPINLYELNIDEKPNNAKHITKFLQNVTDNKLKTAATWVLKGCLERNISEDTRQRILQRLRLREDLDKFFNK